MSERGAAGAQMRGYELRAVGGGPGDFFWGVSSCLRVGDVWGVMGSVSDGEFEGFFAEMIGEAICVAARVLEDRGLAEDAAVEAMARAHLRWLTLSVDPHRRAWVLRVTINAALDIQRSERRRRAREAHSATVAVGREFEQESLDRMVLRGALVKLPRRQREAVALRYLAGLSERDAAVAMGVSAGSLKVHLRRGLSALEGPLTREITGGVSDA